MAVYLRGKTWYINIMVGGVRINRKLPATSRKQALEIQSELKTKYRLGILQISSPESERLFDSEARQYIDHIKKSLSGKTQEDVIRNYQKHIKDIFGQRIIQRMSDKDLLDFQGLKLSQGYSNRTVNIFMGLIRKIMRYSQACKRLTSLDLKFPMLPEPKKHHAFASPDELSKLLGAFNDKSSLAFLRTAFAVNTGLRPKELADLTWDDVSFELRTARVRPITGKGSMERVIPLNETALSVLQSIKMDNRSRYVFGIKGRKVISISKALQTASKNAGIKKISPNMLRHTFASHLLMSGGDIRSLQELMGHTDISTTNRYTHAVQEQLRKNVASLPILDVAKMSQNLRKTTPNCDTLLKRTPNKIK